MASVTVSGIRQQRCDIKIVNLRQIAVNKTARPFKPQEDRNITITQYQDALAPLIGQNPSFSALLSSWETSKNPFFRNVCGYHPEHEELLLTSNLLTPNSSSQQPMILISQVRLVRDGGAAGDIRSVEWKKLRPPSNVPMPASGVPYKDGTLFCSQGNLTPGTGGLYYMPRHRPPVPVVTNHFGWDFNSVQGVALAPTTTTRQHAAANRNGGEDDDVAMYFTDPCHGADGGFRPSPPQLPNQVYRFVPSTGELRVVADGMGRPHGIAVSPDGDTVYVSDADAFRADGECDLSRAATIYAFDVVERSGGTFLANKRVFAYALTSIPMGVVCDPLGNVYVGCADGVEIFSPAGSILGVIEVPGGVSSLTFGREGEMFLCSEQTLWRVKLEGLASLAAAAAAAAAAANTAMTYG